MDNKKNINDDSSMVCKDEIEVKNEKYQIKQQSLKKNFAFQIIYQIILLLLPFVTNGYITRVLGDTNLGNYNYAYSIASYFVLFGMLGIATHGQRVIATSKKDPINLRKAFWSLFYGHIASSIVAIVAYLVFVTFFVKDEQQLYFVLSFFVLSSLFDITWLYSGLENFKIVVIRNLLIRAVATACLFIFVKTKNDIIIYTWITSLASLLGNAFLLPSAIKAIKPIKVSIRECFQHTKPILLYFAVAVAITLYTVFDKTLLGIFTTKEDVAYYTYADKIVAIPRSIIGAIGTVMFPRACALVQENNIDDAKKYVRYSVVVTCFLGFGSMFGMLGIGQDFCTIYYGEEFAESGNMLLWMSPIPLIICLGDVVRMQYMIPKKMDRVFTIIIFGNAAVNLLLSAILIPVLGPYGVIVGTLSAEFVGAFVEIIISRKILSLKELVIKALPFAIIGGIMFAFIILLRSLLVSSILSLIVIILSALVLYSLLSFLYIIFIDSDNRTYRAFISNILTKMHLKTKQVKGD